MKDILFVIPIKKDSVRLPEKAKIKVKGRWILDYTLDYMEQEGFKDQTIVFSDDYEVCNHTESLGFCGKIEHDKPSGSTIRACCRAWKDHRPEAKIICFVNAQVPYKQTGLLADMALRLSNSDCEVCDSVMPLLIQRTSLMEPRKFGNVHVEEAYRVIGGTGDTQDFEERVQNSWAAVMWKVKVIPHNIESIKNQNTLGAWLHTVSIHDNWPWVDVDTPRDLELFNMLIEQYKAPY